MSSFLFLQGDRDSLHTHFPPTQHRFREEMSVPRRILLALVVAGGEAGKFAAYLGGWVSGPMGSSMTTKPIRD